MTQQQNQLDQSNEQNQLTFNTLETYDKPIKSVVPYKLLVAPKKDDDFTLEVVKIRTLVNQEVIVDITPTKQLLSQQGVLTLDKHLLKENNQTESEKRLTLPIIKEQSHPIMQGVQEFLKQSNNLRVHKPQPTKNYTKPVYHNKYVQDLIYLTLDAIFPLEGIQEIMQHPKAHIESDISSKLAMMYQYDEFTNYLGHKELISTFKLITKGNTFMTLTIKTTALESMLLITKQLDATIKQVAILPLRTGVTAGKYYAPKPLDEQDDFRDQLTEEIMNIIENNKVYTQKPKVHQLKHPNYPAAG